MKSLRLDRPSATPTSSGGEAVLSASEVAEYTFCPQAWYLRRHQVAPSPEAQRRLQRGSATHREIGRTTDRMRLVKTLRQILLLAITLVAVLLIAQLAGLVAR